MHRLIRLLCAPACLLAVLAGCGSGGSHATLDATSARQEFERFLQTWQKGGKPAELRQATPQVVVSDADWDAGRKLVRYYIDGKDFNDGRNLHITAQLILQDAARGTVQHELTYIVGTNPLVTIFRK